MARKQKDLPGVAGPGVASVQIEEIDQAAAHYIKERDKRCAMTPKEVEAKTRLIDLLHENADAIGRNGAGVLRYEYDELVIELRPGKERLKIISNDREEENEEEET